MPNPFELYNRIRGQAQNATSGARSPAGNMVEKIRPLAATLSTMKNAVGGAGKEVINTVGSIAEANPFLGAGVGSIGYKPKVPNPLAITKAQELGAKIARVILNPGSELLTPELKGAGVPSFLATGIGFVGDIAAPGPGELGKLAEGEKAFKGFTDLSTKILNDLKGKTTVSKQYILDATNRGELKQAERDITRQVLDTFPDQVNVTDFANKVKTELLPLKRTGPFGKYENITLPEEVRGNVADYGEHIYNSPIKTSAGDVHFAPERGDDYGMRVKDQKGYFGHTRIEDMGDNKTRRVIEVQSDLYQKGRLEDEFTNDTMALRSLGLEDEYSKLRGRRDLTPEQEARVLDIEKQYKNYKPKEYKKLAQYNDPTAHFRMVREEIKKAAEDGKTKLQFPTGETAMKIEGLGETAKWTTPENNLDYVTTGDSKYLVKPESLKVGMEVRQSNINDQWIITDVLGDGKFKAMPKEHFDSAYGEGRGFNFPNNEAMLSYAERHATRNFWGSKESFDISGKVDTNNPIYRFYDKEVSRFLKNKFDAKPVTDSQGVSWMEVTLKPEQAEEPVLAHGKAPIKTLVAGGAVTGLAAAIQLREKIKSLFNNTITIDNKLKTPTISDSLTARPEYVKPTHSSLVPLAEKVQVEYPKIPPRFMKTLIRKEAGSPNSDELNDSNRDSTTGDYRWLTGLVAEGKKSSLDQLRKMGIPFDVSTPEGALKATADYLMWLINNYEPKTPKQLYKLYNGGGTPGAEDTFMELLAE